MRNVMLVLEYDGSAFHGFQVQKAQRTVQGVLEGALLEITGEAIRVAGAGRTDAGVHASGQVVSFRTGTGMRIVRLVQALNAVTPEDVSVRTGREVSSDFHARFSASGRAYRYTMWNGETPSALRRLYSYHWRGALDVGAMAQAARLLVGTQDFASFSGTLDESGKGRRRTTVRTVVRAEVERCKGAVELDFAANAFLPHMVRNLVGTLLLVGSGRLDQEGFRRILAARDRAAAGPAAPARGLCLTEVMYEPSAFEERAGGSQGANDSEDARRQGL